MDHGEYVGPRAELQGQRALIRPDPESEDGVLAQFDDYCTLMGIGWHKFRSRDFKILVPVTWE